MAWEYEEMAGEQTTNVNNPDKYTPSTFFIDTVRLYAKAIPTFDKNKKGNYSYDANSGLLYGITAHTESNRISSEHQIATWVNVFRNTYFRDFKLSVNDDNKEALLELIPLVSFKFDNTINTAFPNPTIENIVKKYIDKDNVDVRQIIELTTQLKNLDSENTNSTTTTSQPVNYPPKFGPVNKVQIMVGKTDDDEDPEGVREGI
ncbi:MAG: hypothetical protein ACK5O9_06405 [Holosporales bacterium]